jgi:hypothetical protein
VIPGALEVNDALLICEETAHMLPEWNSRLAEGAGGRSPAGASTSRWYSAVRMDPTSPAQAEAADGRRAEAARCAHSAAETAHETGDALAGAESKSSMMPRSFETIVSGRAVLLAA